MLVDKPPDEFKKKSIILKPEKHRKSQIVVHPIIEAKLSYLVRLF